MNMMQMVGLMVICFFITLTLLCIYRKAINIKVANGVFIIVDLIFFFWWNYSGYLAGWLDKGYLTFENISPFIMTLIPLTVFMSNRVKAYCRSAIAFLWLGMFVALIFSPQHAYLNSFKSDATFIYASEAACHLLASLYGLFLIITGQVKCDIKHWKRAIICMYSVIGFGVMLNYLFHKSNFGMNPYGNYSIYMIDIFHSFEATLAAYLLGVLLVLTLGMQVGYLFNKLFDSTGWKPHEHHDHSEAEKVEIATVAEVTETAEQTAADQPVAEEQTV